MSIITDLSAGAVGGILGGIGQLAKDIRQAITGDLPAEKQAEITQKLMEIELQTAQAQTKINEVEASNDNVFVAGWRPACGWIGAIALGYAAIVEPISRFVAQVFFKYTGAFPVIDTNITMQILFGILGLGAYRSFEKAKGTK